MTEGRQQKWSRTKGRSFACIALASLASSCGWRTTGEAARELAVRHVVGLHGEACNSDDVHYLVTSGRAPDEDLLQRLSADGLTLVPASAATHDLAKSRPLPAAGERSVTVWVTGFDQSGEHHGAIAAGWIGPGKAGESLLLAVERKGGSWQVASARELEETDGDVGR